jgi:hypothetical protein
VTAVSHLDDPIPIELPEAVMAAIVAAIRHACGIVAQSHNPDELWDEYTLGTGRWRLTWNWVRKRLEELGPVVTIYDDERSLRALVEDQFVVSFYPGGYGLGWDPYSYDFTRSRKRAEVATNNGVHQLVLDYGIEPDMLGRPEMNEPAQAGELSVVYAIDPASGGVAIYLGAPVVSDAGTITWGWVRRIHTDLRATGEPPASATSPYRPYNQGPEPDLGLALVEPTDEAAQQGGAS